MCFFGVPSWQKGVQSYAISDQRFYVSRDVVVHEASFPFAQQQHNSQTLPIFHPATFHDSFPSHDDAGISVPTNATTPSSSENDTIISSPSHKAIDRPQRSHKPPSYLKDYVLCNPTTTCTSHCLATTTNLYIQPPSISSYHLSYSNQELLSTIPIN